LLNLSKAQTDAKEPFYRDANYSLPGRVLRSNVPKERGMIKEQEAGMSTSEVRRRHELSPASFYKFKAKFGGMNVSDTRRSKSLEDENAKLKRLLADTMLDNVVLKDLIGRN